jgi:thiamine transport system ATP-binding protein
VTEPRLRVEGATVRFPTTLALDGVDLCVDPGEVVAVLGASGSGKSTLLRAVAGLQPLDAGRILLDGADQTGVPPHRRDVGLMFQDHALFPHRDVAANVAFGLRMRRVDRAATSRRVGELLELVGLTGFGRRSITTLSGGEQQRVALARSLAPEPRLLMLDEPLGSLDRALRERLVADLRALFTRLDLTVVAVTHDQGEAFTLADRLVVLGEGRVLREGSPDEVWTDPQRAEVARLIGLENVRDGCLIRPSAVRIEPGGPLRAVVERVSFRGDRQAVHLAVDGEGPLTAEVPAGEAPAAGERVRVSIDRRGVVPLR